MKRLSKALAAAGVASRRKCEELIFNGHVTVNGKVVTVPQTLVSFSDDLIKIDGQLIKKESKKVYYLLNKPTGYLCSNERENERQRLVIDLFSDERLFTVGRLDRDTEGLLLVTNDGNFSQKVIHPSSNVQKEYLVKVKNELKPEILERLRGGGYVEGVRVTPVKVTKVRRGTFKIVVREGRKREIRELVDQAGLNLVLLRRIRIGNLSLGDLPIGAHRELTDAEIEEFL